MKFLPWAAAAGIFLMIWMWQEYKQAKVMQQSYEVAQQYNQHQAQIMTEMRQREEAMMRAEENYGDMPDDKKASKLAEPPRRDWAQVCHDGSLLGERAMHMHQHGKALSEMMSLTESADPDIRSIIQQQVKEAFKAPRYDNPQQQQELVNTFKSTVFRVCMRDHA